MSGGYQEQPTASRSRLGFEKSYGPAGGNGEELSYDGLMDSFAQKNNLLESLLKSLENAIHPHLIPNSSCPPQDVGPIGEGSLLAVSISSRLVDYNSLLDDFAMLISRIQR
jgi:hypothetical protein